VAVARPGGEQRDSALSTTTTKAEQQTRSNNNKRAARVQINYQLHAPRDKITAHASEPAKREASPRRALTTTTNRDHPIVMADQRLQQAEVLAKLGIAIRIVAQQNAIKEVKRQLRAQGLKLQQFTHREIVVAAETYLAEHPELITEAKPTVLRWFAAGVFGKRAARSVQNLRLTHSAPRPELQAL
jgi:hypothetical protein